MNELLSTAIPAQPPRQDARDLQSRLYREIGLAAVEAALFAPDLLLAEIQQRQIERGAAEAKVLTFPNRAA
ncbi:hypothetical protein CCR94_08600 [Rhodoblastus sphagnicola]|uniref:Uncharacterized protein n=1 Tax=Rhodoblastus sphagnicola TaxID=333368 RepID=A0A2S6NAG4_9HYPH|nr:hypothetical protein [Rhodoblastus sphagnicola]MBB4199558.1 hypothetical protein [Rhodoblastus sphagnicola]PPQ31599.1 hypothetical protein CCR94_08600 [Rhodoblastus sphagnicola]